ncbi:hypothetical protein PPERSA_06126 [Pseudocohnilembus persalinus]|uniref:P-type ATPase A domain-containing protein n=1 Tax=Pseudocohnilembus persalinus TaxID=266149 RepID=A0A0V0QVK8_PSEPJ|nr:hypothetical protein PPERSA_06126 [Pseudocohnilembus persalinus]|eukprot:KRX06244.1 hypothetical protein PPERSA_06126 [Pseudocohnilembus persalinus]
MKIFSLFQTTGLILLIMFVGKYIEGIAKKSIVSMIDKILPPQNQLVQSNKVQYIVPKNRWLIIKEEKIVNVSLLNKFDIIRVLPKQKILIDGVVLKIEENSQNQKMEFFVNDSVNYGEDEARQLKVGDRISSGATIVSGSALVQVENALEDSILSKISLQLNQAQNSSGESQNNESITNILQQVSEYFVKGVILLSITILFIWAVVIGFDLIDEQYLKHNVCVICIPFERAVSVMVASCPCVIGLAIPSVVAIALNLAMKHNIIIKNTSSFESINQVKSIIFDKTGTLFTQFDQIFIVKMRLYLKGMGLKGMQKINKMIINFKF